LSGNYGCKNIERAEHQSDLQASKLTEDEVSKIAQILDRDFAVEGQLQERMYPRTSHA
jgi:ribosomal protein S13